MSPLNLGDYVACSQPYVNLDLSIILSVSSLRASTSSIRPWDLHLSLPHPKRCGREPLSYSYVEFKILVPIVSDKRRTSCETEEPTMVPWHCGMGSQDWSNTGESFKCTRPLTIYDQHQSAYTARPLSPMVSISIHCSVIARTPAECQSYARPCWSCLGL